MTTSTLTRLPASRLRLTEPDLCGWLGRAKPGDVVEYHRGFLAIDLWAHGSRFTERERHELMNISRRAWWAAVQGLAHLVQRRNGPEDFSYLAVARRKPKRPPVLLLSLNGREAA
jgi:hypothetical protein